MPKAAQIVKIENDSCIGCTKCINVCPVDAIVGAAKQMHLVLKEYCIGCELCIPPCPVDCITIVPMENKDPASRREQAQIAKKRHQARKIRLAKIAQQKNLDDQQTLAQNMKDAIAASIARAQQKRRNTWVLMDE